MIKFIKYVLLCFFIPVQHCLAQEMKRPETCSAFLPNILLQNTAMQISDTKQISSLNGWGQNDSTTNKYWIAYSDGNNIVYTLPDNSSTESGCVHVSEKLRIAEIAGDYALVYDEKSPGAVSYPQISGKAEFKGWIPMDRLLLWTACPVDNASNCQKAFISQETMKNLLHTHNLPCHYSKSSAQGFDTFALYIYKEEGDSVLLARSSNISGRHEDEILGWTKRENITPWNNRLCIEPVWDTDSVAALATANEKAEFYDDIFLTDKIAEFAFGKNPKGKNYRLPTNVLRFPLLNSSDSLRYRVVLPIKYQRPFDNVEYICGTACYAKRTSTDGKQLWNKVILISNTELTEALRRLEPVLALINASAGDVDDRKKLVEACQKAGDVFGCDTPVSEEILSVLDTDFVSTEDFIAIMHRYRDKCETLSRIGRSSYKYSCTIDGIKYYIIPINELP